MRRVRRCAIGAVHDQQWQGLRDVGVCAYKQMRERCRVGGEPVLRAVVLRFWPRLCTLLPSPAEVGVIADTSTRRAGSELGFELGKG